MSVVVDDALVCACVLGGRRVVRVVVVARCYYEIVLWATMGVRVYMTDRRTRGLPLCSSVTKCSVFSAVQRGDSGRACRAVIFAMQR